MPHRPLIGITCSSVVPTDTESPHDRMNHAYTRAVWNAGGEPVILPNLGQTEYAEAIVGRLDGLLLSGGNDVSPALYGEDVLNETVRVDGPRDASEMPLIRAAVERDLPILAICRGIQSLNVALGGTLIQDIPTQAPSDVAHRQKDARDVDTHLVAVEPGSLFAQVVGEEPLPTNSFHHQAVRDVTEGYQVSGRAPDGTIEAMEDPLREFVLAVQFHPEEMVGVSERCRRLFTAFVDAARKHQERRPQCE